MAAFVADVRDSYPDREEYRRLHSDISNCATYLVFHQYVTRDETRLAKAHTCKKHLLCPFCARRRAGKAVAKNEEKMLQVMKENPHLKPVMITLTVKNGEDLQERFDHLQRSFRRLMDRRRDYLKKGRGKTEFRKVAGSVYSYEFTNRGEGWHPHVHMIALVDRWIDQEALSQEWYSVTGDSFIVDVRRIKPNKRHGTLDITSGLLEVLKYAVKFHDLDLELNWEAYEVLKGKRLLGSFGVLRGVQEPDNLLDDLLQDEPYLELYYRYSFRRSVYDLTQVRRVEPSTVSDDGEERTGAELEAVNPATGEIVHQDYARDFKAFCWFASEEENRRKAGLYEDIGDVNSSSQNQTSTPTLGAGRQAGGGG